MVRPSDNRCLILSCSQSKNPARGLLPAIERYDGPAFRVVRRFLRTTPSGMREVDVYVLSAKYGLIAAPTMIHDYDQRMTPARAMELRPLVLDRLREVLQYGYTEMFFSLSRPYLRAIEGFEALVPKGLRIIVSISPMGKRLTDLKCWLHRSSGEDSSHLHTKEYSLRVSGRATLKGRQIEATAGEVLQQARRALLEGYGNPQNFREWYVLVDGEKVSTKWIVSLLSGLPVSAFQASEARRVLGQLGVPVYRDGKKHGPG